MEFNASEHLYDGGAPSHMPQLDRLLADAEKAAEMGEDVAVDLVYHVTSMSPLQRDAARLFYDPDRMRTTLHIIVPCPLADHGMHEWGDGLADQQGETVAEFLRRSWWNA